VLVFFTKFNCKYFYYFFIFHFLTSCYKDTKDVVELTLKNNDSINIKINQSREKGNDLTSIKDKLSDAYKLIEKEERDSFKNEYLLKIAYEALKINDSILFKLANHDANNLSKKINDTIGIAETLWNYGDYFVQNEKMDSAYNHFYQANKLYNSMHHKYYSAKMLFNMAYIQGRLKDYTGSEKQTFQAISKFKELNKNLSLYRCYNHLGVIFNELEEFDKAIFYHDEALSYLEKVSNKNTYKEGSLNNLSLVYGKQKNFVKAIQYLDEALDNDSLKFLDINLYAKLIDNRAYYRFLSGDSTNVLVELSKSLEIKDSLDNISGIVISKLHLAEFYSIYKDTMMAIENAKKSYVLSKKINNNRDKLASLKLLSKLDKMNSNKYLNEYILLADSLQFKERKTRNKFARIRFETEEYFEETQRLFEQKIWILLVSFFIVLIIILLYYIKVQKSKQNKLFFDKEQELANEEIYSLILKQQSKLEEGQLHERNRISEELHDGILGKLFGIRMGFGFLNLKGDDITLHKYKSQVGEIQQIEKEIRAISHDLKNEILFSKLNFITSVKDLVVNQCETGDYQYNITIDDTICWKEVDEKIKINLYRIIQEALQNINKYSKATKVDIDFNLIDKMIKLSIKDNGIGFDTKKEKNGIGLKNIFLRAQKFDGEFVVNSIIYKGTILTISIPV